MSNLTKYNPYTEEAASEEEQELAKSGGDFLKPGVGENVYRFLPPIGEQRSPFVLVHQHFVELPGMSKPVSFNCPRVMAHRACIVCQKIDKLKASGNKVDYDLAGQLFPSLRIYSNVIDRSRPEMGPQKLGYGKKIHEQLVKIRKSKNGGDFTDPTDKGFDIIVERQGTGKNDTKYQVWADRENSSLGDMAWIDQQANLFMYSRVPEDDEIIRMLEQAGGNLIAARSQADDVRGGPRGRSAPQQPPQRAQATPPAQQAAPPPKRRTAEDDAIMAEFEEVDDE